MAGTARNLRPINARNASGNIVTTNADFQAFSSVESGNLQASAVAASVISNTEEVLNYGFTARKNATTRAFANGDTGSVTVSYKIPIGLQNNNTYRFSATFVVADETVSRVTRDVDESTASVNARAAAFSPAAAETAFLGADTDTAGAGTTVRLRNSKIGAQSTYLLNTSATTLAISEVLRNVPGVDSPNEYIELRGTPSSTIPAFTYLVAIEGDTAPANQGEIIPLIDLGGSSIGSNGFRFLGQPSYTYTVNASATSSSAGWPVDLGNGTHSFLLIAAGSALTASVDVDSNNDCILDGVASQWIILDSVGLFDAGGADCVYSKIAFKPDANTGIAPRATTVVSTGTTTLDYAARRANSENYTYSATDWRAALVSGTSPNWAFTTAFPAGDVSQTLNHFGSSNP